MSGKSSKSSSSFEISEKVLQKLSGKWSYQDGDSPTENWEAAVQIAPELKDGTIPINKRSYLQFISKRLQPAAQNPFESYIEAAKKTGPVFLPAQPTTVEIASSISLNSAPQYIESHETIAARLQPNDRRIFEAAIRETNQYLGN